jgi:DNA repair photolyase
MIKEIQAKVILSTVKQPDTWFGLKYNMNLYRGCQHQCIYCDSRSECYQIENFNDILVKANAIELLRKELSRKRVKGTIGTGSMNDPYMPVESERKLTGQAMQVIADYKFGVHVLTKSDLVLRDIELLKAISKVFAAVSFTVTTADDGLGKILEPGASLVSARLAAMKKLSEQGIHTGITLMPVLPFIEDTEENIVQIVEAAHQNGAAYIIPAFSVTMRDRQRDYFYNKLDRFFPGVREKYQKHYGNQYGCVPRNADQLYKVFNELCRNYKILTRMPVYQPQTVQQLSFF